MFSHRKGISVACHSLRFLIVNLRKKNNNNWLLLGCKARKAYLVCLVLPYLSLHLLSIYFKSNSNSISNLKTKSKSNSKSNSIFNSKSDSSPNSRPRDYFSLSDFTQPIHVAPYSRPTSHRNCDLRNRAWHRRIIHP